MTGCGKAIFRALLLTVAVVIVVIVICCVRSINDNNSNRNVCISYNYRRAAVSLKTIVAIVISLSVMGAL